MKRLPLSALPAFLVLAVLASCSSVPTFSASDLSTSVRVTDRGGWIVLEPTIAPVQALGLVFYPGGLVRPEAYELAMVPIVQAGYPVVIVKMPFDLAVFATQKGLGDRRAGIGPKDARMDRKSFGRRVLAEVLGFGANIGYPRDRGAVDVDRSRC